MINVEICNIALGYLKATPIASWDQNTESALQCRRLYDLTRQTLLRAYPWSFARKIIALAKLPGSVPDWRYLYQQPADCLGIRKIYTGDSIHAFKSHMEQYAVFSLSETTQAIACNLPNAWMDYTFDLNNTAAFPADFIKAFSYLLASELAIQLSADTSAKELNFSLYQEALAQALKMNFNENMERVHFRSEIFAARSEEGY